MIPPKLGRLERVGLRAVWASEAADFTPWLAQEENLRLLGETVGIELELEAQETEVGPFRADILCKNTPDDSWVLIENQLERTDHTHLGQLLTYAAGLEAVTIIWVAERFTEEHRATLDWLIQITAERFAFFGLEIELWRIGESPVAPKFNIVSSPNDWARTVQCSAGRSGQLSETKQAQLNFWTAFKQHMEESGSFVRCQKPLPQHWMNHYIGKGGVNLCSVASTLDSITNTYCPELRVELVTSGQHSKSYFAQLHAQKEEVESELGQPLVWHNPEGAKMCRIYLRRPADFRSAPEWPQQHEWLRQTVEKFHQVFARRVRQLEFSKAQAAAFEPNLPA
jgi:Fe-S-cluster containining protein